MSELFELAPAEVRTPFTFREGAARQRVIHVHHLPKLEDWLAHEEKLQARIKEVGEQSRAEDQQLEAAEVMWERTAMRVEGYPVRVPELAEKDPMSGTSATAEMCRVHPDTWKGLVPISHKAVSVRLLQRVRISARVIGEQEEYIFDPNSVTVLVDGWQDGCDYTGLCHRLRRPTPQEAKEFSRVISSTVWLRGARIPTTLVPSRLSYLVKLYDQLVESVAGYSVQGTAVERRDDAIRHMWAPHKRAAVMGLFSVEDDSVQTIEE